MRPLTLVLVLNLLFTSTASAQTTTTQPTSGEQVTNSERICTPSENAQNGHCSGTETTTSVGTTLQGSAAGAPVVYLSSGGSKKTYLPYDKIVHLPDGGFCVTTGYYEEGTPYPDDNISNAPGAHPGGNGFNNNYDVAPCTGQPAAPGQPAAAETPLEIAKRYVQDIPLPKPRPTIAPGRAITGKLAYLETKGELSHTYTNNTVLGPLAFVAHGSYLVDWGDGQTSGPYSFEGAPWPDGRITHEYPNVGTYNVVVSEKWTADWSLGGENGVLPALATTGRIDNFPVQQIQAVIGR